MMLSVLRFQPLLVGRQASCSMITPRVDSIRRAFLTIGRSSRFQARRSDPLNHLTTRDPLPSGPKLLKPFFFTIGFSGSCFALASIWEYEQMRSQALEFKNRATSWIKRQTQSQKHGEFRNHLNLWWNSLGPENKLFYGIVFINACVFAAWKVPSWRGFMVANFYANPFARAVCWPMVLSTFSHSSILHFGINMFVLQSFMHVASDSVMGKEQFLAFYLSAGVVSSLGSHIFKALTRSPGFSLGASGAILGVLGYFCSVYPDARLQIAFIPGYTFSADTGLKAMLCFDTLGLLLRWKLFDHAAHLGGALFGMFWYYWGQQGVWKQRVGFLEVWHQFRSAGPSDE